MEEDKGRRKTTKGTDHSGMENTRGKSKALEKVF